MPTESDSNDRRVRVRRRADLQTDIAGVTAVVFPFDLFGSGGSGGGAELVADELREILADNRRERTPTRARAYQGRLRLRSFSFETMQSYQHWRVRGRRLAHQLVGKGDFLLWIAGNHLGVLPVYEELGEETLVVQMDAHLDIHQFSSCTPELSHGNFLRHCTRPLPRIVNIGHREQLLLPEDISNWYHSAYPAEALAVDTGRVLRSLRQAARRAKRIFLDIDCDVFDPAYFPAVAQPVPFGLAPQQILAVIDAVWSERVAGFALSEFDPSRDQSDRSLATLMWLIEYLLLRHCGPRPGKHKGERPVS